MTSPAEPAPRAPDTLGDLLTTTRRGLAERMTDPHLSDHDRWVLRQFAAFLAGAAPGPDPRRVRVSAIGTLRDGAPGRRV